MANQIIAEYVWIGGQNELRSKARTLYIDKDPTSLENYPKWNYDGSSTIQAKGKDSEVVIIPRAVFGCPFRRVPNVLVLCDTHSPSGLPLKSNTRLDADTIFKEKLDEEPWFGIEQEYFMMDPLTGKPLGLPVDEGAQGQYYCSAGIQNAFGRSLADEHYKACLYAGIKMSGINAEVAPGQWEYQVGPCLGVEAGDHLCMARYILERLSEKHGIVICLEPKPLEGDWNGSGCHTNYSTKNMREGSEDKTGLEFIEEAVDKLSLKHKEHMDVYGTGNEKRMTGEHETAKCDQFSSGVANRGASVRIGNETAKDKKGYFEDRRPSSNMDPYLVTGILFKTTVLD